jgi:metal-dependent HD superfamily phosphatase/phosphodiesterase
MIREVNRFDAHKNPEMVQYFLGNVMRRVMQKLNYVEVGASKKFINMKNCMEIENVLVFSGFKVAFEMLENGYYLTVDTTKKIVRYESVLEFITYLYKINQNR